VENVGVAHFSNIFKEPLRENMVEIIKLSTYIPRFVNIEQNGILMEEVRKEESKAILCSLQKDKIQGPYGWPMELYFGFYELIEEDLLRVVEKSKVSGRVLVDLNTTFMELIPKKDDSKTLEAFKPISLCNSIYKSISKLIVRRIKPIFSKGTSTASI
jgi:hypothetical protein